MSSSNQTPEFSLEHFDRIYINLHAASDFRIRRTRRSQPTALEDEIAELAQHVKNGCFKVVSINGSQHSCVVVVTTPLSGEELVKKGFI